MNEQVHIAKTILQQIPIMDKMAIGLRQTSAMSESDDYRGGASFRVNSMLRFCDVRLMWDDTYSVEYYRIKRGSLDRVVLATADQVYCDVLGTVLYNMTQATDDYNAERKTTGALWT